MEGIDPLRELTRKIVRLSEDPKHEPMIACARQLTDLARRTTKAAVSEWLRSLHNQPGSVRALCAAEAALASDDNGTETLGDLLSGWLDWDLAERSLTDLEDALKYHAASAPERSWKPVFRIYAAHEAKPRTPLVQVRLRIQLAAGDGTMLWDERPCGDSDPVALAIALAGTGTDVDYRAGSKPAGPEPRPLDRFHPERFMSQHPSVRRLSSLATAVAAQGGLTYEVLDRIQSTVVADGNASLSELPMAIRHRLPSLGSAPYAQVGSLASHILLWMAAGRQIYDLPASLVQSFRRTDVDDVPLSLLRLPYDALFIYWGPQADLELEPGWLVDGAYVSRVGDVLQLVVTAAPVDPRESRWWPVKGEPYYYQALEQDVMGMDVGTAVDTVLAKELADLRARATKEAADLDELLATMATNGEIDPLHMPAHVEDVSARTASQQIERSTRRYAAYVSSLKLVINALCYLTAYPDDSDAKYPPTAPEPLVRAAGSTDFKTAKSARGRLAEMGYLPVRLCGRELARHGGGWRADGAGVRAHWRRGHWRRQPYGEGRALRKLVWVMPTVVGADGAEPPGHIYRVS